MCFKKSVRIEKEAVIRRTENTMIKRKTTKGQKMINKTVQRKQQIEQYEPHLNVVNSDVSKGW